MGRKALVVGINDYEGDELEAPVLDAFKLTEILARHENGTRNFDCECVTSFQTEITQALLRKKLVELFDTDEGDVVLFYFAGHGHHDEFGWYLVTEDRKPYDVGVPMSDIIRLAQRSNATETFIILDCCNAGGAGAHPFVDDLSYLPEGVTILAASNPKQAAREGAKAGELTKIVIEGLKGEAAGLLGMVTIARLYDFADMLFNEWQQRPQFKSNISRVNPIRKCKPKIDLDTLRKLIDYFPKADSEYPLTPAYDRAFLPSNPDKEAIMDDFRLYARLGLLIPVGVDYLYDAAEQEKSCALTLTGRFYWKLIYKDLI